MHSIPQKVTLCDHIHNLQVVDVNTHDRVRHHFQDNTYRLFIKISGIRRLISRERLAHHTSRETVLNRLALQCQASFTYSTFVWVWLPVERSSFDRSIMHGVPMQCVMCAHVAVETNTMDIQK